MSTETTPSYGGCENTLEKRVKEDIRCHRENGVSLNPYSTDMARGAWQRGFEGSPPKTGEWVDCYDRGRMAARLVKEV